MKRLISVLTAVCLLLTAMPLSVWAQMQEIPIQVNPFYADVLDREQLEAELAALPPAAQPLSTDYISKDEAIVQLREQMKNRQNSIVIQVKSTEEDRHKLAREIFYGAIVHTGQPAEGDNLAWHWTSCSWNASRKASGGCYNYTITYSIGYYTDAAQEAELDAAVEELLDQWDLDGASDLEKVRAVYDYITANVKYAGNMNGLQYTSYGALIHGSCVCQGYANLFYRLALELGVDNRIVTGWGGLGGHAWNLVEIDGVYYYVDSTWDAGKEEYDYFLKGSMIFDKDHTPDAACTDWLTDYNISKLDLCIGTEEWPITGTCGDDLTWSLTENGLLTISGTGAMWESDWNHSGWRQYSNWVLECVIEEGVTTIGAYAFDDCSFLTDLTIGSSVTSIGDDAFSGCKSLTSVNIPDGITAIGNYTFYDCSNLTSVTIPYNVTSIGRNAFAYCSDLTSINIPSNVTSIGDFAFDNCKNLEDVYYGGSETEWLHIEIGDGNESLTNATIHYNDFEHNPLPDVDKELASGTCGDHVAWSLTEGGVLTISGNGAMWDFLWRDPEWEQYESRVRKCVIEEGVTTVGEFVFENYGSLTEVIIGDSVTTIGMYAFSGCSNLTDLTIGSSVTKICEWAFYGCESLTGVTIPDSVTAIDMYAFHECYGLTSVVIPDGITSISYATFAYCDNLTSVTIPGSVTFIAEFAFYRCNILEDVYYGGTEEQWAQISIDDGNAPLAVATIHYTDPTPAVLYGDTNGDSKVNALDLILLRQHLAEWDVELDLLSADANGDGMVNILDLVLLRQYLAGWDVNPGP